jgi:hypothetical protein
MSCPLLLPCYSRFPPCMQHNRHWPYPSSGAQKSGLQLAQDWRPQNFAFGSHRTESTKARARTKPHAPYSPQLAHNCGLIRKAQDGYTILNHLTCIQYVISTPFINPILRNSLTNLRIHNDTNPFGAPETRFVTLLPLPQSYTESTPSCPLSALSPLLRSSPDPTTQPHKLSPARHFPWRPSYPPTSACSCPW